MLIRRRWRRSRVTHVSHLITQVSSTRLWRSSASLATTATRCSHGGATSKELLKEFWLSLSAAARENCLDKWAARQGVPLRVVTLCSGSEAPIQAMNDLADIYNDSLSGDMIGCFFTQLASCDMKDTARKFSSANFNCRLHFHRIPQ